MIFMSLDLQKSDEYTGRATFTEVTRQDMIRRLLRLDARNSPLNLRVAGIISLEDSLNASKKIKIPLFFYSNPCDAEQNSHNASFCSLLERLRGTHEFDAEWCELTRRDRPTEVCGYNVNFSFFSRKFNLVYLSNHPEIYKNLTLIETD